MTALPLRTALPEAEKFSDRDSHPFRVTPDLSDPRMLRGRRSGRRGPRTPRPIKTGRGTVNATIDEEHGPWCSPSSRSNEEGGGAALRGVPRAARLLRFPLRAITFFWRREILSHIISMRQALLPPSKIARAASGDDLTGFGLVLVLRSGGIRTGRKEL